MTQSGSGNQGGGLGDNPIVVLVSALAALITIIIFVSGRQYLGDLLPNPLPTPMLEETVAAAAAATVQALRPNPASNFTDPTDSSLSASNDTKPTATALSPTNTPEPDLPSQTPTSEPTHTQEPAFLPSTPAISFGPRMVLRPYRVSASSVAPPAPDSQGNTISYEPEEAVDGDDATAWRVPGDGINQFIQLNFTTPVQITEIRVMPGYAKTDPFDGTDRFAQTDR